MFVLRGTYSNTDHVDAGETARLRFDCIAKLQKIKPEAR